MSDTKIFHDYSNLSFLKVTVDEYELLVGDVMSVQIDQSLKVGGLVGVIEFKDTFDIFNNNETTLNNENVVTVSFRDFSGDASIRTYRITNITHRKYDERFRIVRLSLLDEITFILSNTYTDFYYNGDCATGAKNLIESLVSDVISSNRLSISSVGNTESASSTLLCNSTRSVLDSLMIKLSTYNLRIFQSRDSILIKEIVPSALTPFENVFTDKTHNNKYIYKIFDREQSTVNNIDAPKTINYRVDGKTINTDTKNLEDVASDLTINSNANPTTNLQSSTSKKIVQTTHAQGIQKMKLFDKFMATNRMQIAVVGTILGGKIDSVISCLFNGVVGFSDITIEGDSMNSGNYYVSGVSDLFIGQKYIQRLTVSRVETPSN